MITNIELKNILLGIMRVIPSSGHSSENKGPIYKLIDAIPDEEPVPKTGFDPNEAEWRKLDEISTQFTKERCGKMDATYPADPNHDEYFDKPKGDPDIEHD
jgi:hypothetical protein